jgi:hypothetical protein
MDDPAAPPIGTQGTVTGVDDIGDILVDWNNGSSLNVVPEVYHIRKNSEYKKQTSRTEGLFPYAACYNISLRSLCSLVMIVYCMEYIIVIVICNFSYALVIPSC